MELSSFTQSEPIDNVRVRPLETQDVESIGSFSNEASVPAHARKFCSTESFHKDTAECEEWEEMDVASGVKLNGTTAL